MRAQFVTRALALVLASTFLAACNSGTRKSTSAAVVAPISSGTTSPTTSGSTGGVGSSQAAIRPDFGGQVAALGSAAPVAASLELGAYRAFRESQAVSDLVIPDVPGLRDRLFAVEDTGFVRVLSLAGTAPTLDRALPLAAAPFPTGVATGALVIHDERAALVTASGQGGEAVYRFDPRTARTAQDVLRYDVGAITVTWPAGTRDSKGVDVGGGALPLTYTSGAALVGDRLFVTCSNLDASFDLRPGTLLALDLDPQTGALLPGGAVLKTTDFNPTAVTRVQTAAGPVLLVTNSGVYGAGPSSIDVVDPLSLRLLGTIPLGARNAHGRVIVSPDGARGYLPGQSSPDVYVLDLEGLEATLANMAPADLSARFLGGVALAGPAGGLVSSLALSHTGRYLYAVDFNASALWVVDLANPEGIAARVAGFARSGLPANFEGLANGVAVRPGVPGVDYQGASIHVLTMNLAAADQTIANVRVALDRVTVDRH